MKKCNCGIQVECVLYTVLDMKNCNSFVQMQCALRRFTMGLSADNGLRVGRYSKFLIKKLHIGNLLGFEKILASIIDKMAYRPTI